MLETIEIDLHGADTLTVYINVHDNSLSCRWLTALNHLLVNNYHLEKNFCFLGFADSKRNAEYLCTQINRSIQAVNSADLGYRIGDFYSPGNTINRDLSLKHERLNSLHRYFEDLQGVSGAMSPFYNQADAYTRWHIRQLNLLCHEYESLVLSKRKAAQAPEWQRPSQLMCWLNAPRFVLEPEDYELFGVDTISRALGGVYLGVNKAVGKHHWEVFNDEGRDSRISELITSTLRTQTEAAGDFDIEWAQSPAGYTWQEQQLDDFRAWLRTNGFDPEDKSLTIGHPQVAQVDLEKSFGTNNYHAIWQRLNTHLDVSAIRTSTTHAVFSYHWSDPDFVERQVEIIKG